MNLLSNAVQKTHSEEKEVRLFRSEVKSLVVGSTTLRTTNLSGLRPGGVKVSEYRLEQYLNACSPTCHG